MVFRQLEAQNFNSVPEIVATGRTLSHFTLTDLGSMNAAYQLCIT